MNLILISNYPFLTNEKVEGHGEGMAWKGVR